MIEISEEDVKAYPKTEKYYVKEFYDSIRFKNPTVAIIDEHGSWVSGYFIEDLLPDFVDLYMKFISDFNTEKLIVSYWFSAPDFLIFYEYS